MNIIILLIGLLLIIVASMIILFNRRNIDDNYVTNDVNDINSVFVENEKGFEKVLDNLSTYDRNNGYVFDNEKELLDSLSMTLNSIDIESEDSEDVNYKEETEDNPQNSDYDKIIELSKSGLRTEEIAKILGRGIREVEITLRFYNKKNK